MRGRTAPHHGSALNWPRNAGRAGRDPRWLLPAGVAVAAATLPVYLLAGTVVLDVVTQAGWMLLVLLRSAPPTSTASTSPAY